jgi:hypothetical protein
MALSRDRNQTHDNRRLEHRYITYMLHYVTRCAILSAVGVLWICKPEMLIPSSVYRR